MHLHLYTFEVERSSINRDKSLFQRWFLVLTMVCLYLVICTVNFRYLVEVLDGISCETHPWPMCVSKAITYFIIGLMMYGMLLVSCVWNKIWMNE